MLKATQEQEWWADQVVQVMLHGKRALDAAMLDVGRLVAETLMYMEREERSLCCVFFMDSTTKSIFSLLASLSASAP